MVAFSTEVEPVDETEYNLRRQLRDADWRIHKLRGLVYIERRRRWSGNLFAAVIGGTIVWLVLATVKAWPF